LGDHVGGAVDGALDAAAPVVVEVGGDGVVGGFVDVGEAVPGVVVVAVGAVVGEVAIVVVGMGRGADGGVLVEAVGGVADRRAVVCRTDCGRDMTTASR